MVYFVKEEKVTFLKKQKNGGSIMLKTILKAIKNQNEFQVISLVGNTIFLRTLEGQNYSICLFDGELFFVHEGETLFSEYNISEFLHNVKVFSTSGIDETFGFLTETHLYA